MSIRQLFLGMGILAGATLAHADMVLVANPSNSLSSLPQSQVSRLFLGQTGTFPDGSRAIPLDVEGDSRARFYRDVLKRQPDQIEKYWARMIFTGKAQPPREVKAREVKALVAETPGAISYIDSSLVDASVKVIRVETGS
ncbi:MAG: hypothetical protein Q8J78_07985 [Moraxellaceae bacterium]|nr:hypothetical protein [Moraxellaceae bacterium]